MRTFSLVILVIAILMPLPSSAMRVQMFDAMAVEDQRDYVAFMSRRAQEILIEEGRRDLAKRINELFRKRRGDKRSVGEAQFYNHLERMRSSRAELAALRMEVRFYGADGEVESAFLTTIAGNQVQIPTRLASTFSRSLRERPFWPTRPLRVQ